MPRKAVLIAISTLALLLIGVGGMRLLIRLRTAPPRQVVETTGKLVRATPVIRQDVPIIIEGFGTVRAKTKWSAVPEVSGTVVHLSPHLRAGLHVSKGELLFEIDPRPYRLAVQRLRAHITQLQKEIAVLMQERQNHLATLRIAEGNLAIAEEELKRDEALVRKGTISARELDRRRQWRNEYITAVQTTMNHLALIAPHVEKAEAAIAVAQAQLAEAELKLEKTRLMAPFDGQVTSSSLDPGEFVQEGREVATLYDTAAVEIPLAIPLEELRWLPGLSPETMRGDAPDSTGQRTLPPATVRWHSGKEVYTWPGEVVRWEAEMDQKTRTLTLVVEVQDPWGQFRPGQHPPLPPGTFCEVAIAAMTIPGAILIPRLALHENNTVFLAQDDVLVIRPVQVLRLLKEQALITTGLQPGERLIVSPITAPVAGMKLRVLEAESPLPASTPTVRQSSAATVLVTSPPRQREER